RQKFRLTDIYPGESPKELYVRLKELYVRLKELYYCGCYLLSCRYGLGNTNGCRGCVIG
ncbi:hypothetical protein FQN60_017511, partial [Etheostoma spectabile]